MNIISINTIQNSYLSTGRKTNAVHDAIEADFRDVCSSTIINSLSENSIKPMPKLNKKFICGNPSAEAVVSSEHIAEQRKEFTDMYVTSAAHKNFLDSRYKSLSSSELLSLRIENARTASKNECVLIPIEAGELPRFMDTVQNFLKNGTPLEDILKQKYNLHISKYGEEGHTNSFADWFAINTSTGEVMSADPISRTYCGDSLDREISDIEAVMELADDLAAFLRYAVFSQETDDPKRVGELISFIKNKQAYANYDRFIASDGDETAYNTISENLIAAGVLKSDDEEKEKKKAEAVDGFIESIRIHQDKLREYKIDLNGSEKIFTEFHEITGKS